MLILFVLTVAAVAATGRSEELLGATCGYESCTQAERDVLNVHIVPHTHDDVGWLKTVDQYYYGSRNNIQKAGVQYILDSVVKELWEDPKRRFIYVETAFFWKWWVRQDDAVRTKVHELVRQGRLQFVGGAWSMNDEAASHYQSTIDQFTWGLSKLNRTFGACGMPRVGWQIDPFGHSRELASLLSGMGYDGLFLGRLDYQDKWKRLNNKEMEMVWRGDDDLGKSSDIFTGVLYNTYSPPPGFCFDVLCSDEPIIDDPQSPMYNVESRVYKFLEYIKGQSRYYRTENIILTMGGDFTYQDAGMWYKNLDKLIEHTNLIAAKDDLKIKLFYSTPDCYLKAIKEFNPTLPIKQDDFFPYASDSTAYWTGYFTSRPTTKYFERQGNSYLQMVKQLQVLANLDEHNMFVLDELKSALGIWQHHDAITGTEKQHVTSDYERILDQAIDDALIIANEAFNKITQPASHIEQLRYYRCHLNESRCHTSETKNQFIVTVYNHLGWHVNDSIRIPVVDGQYEVYAPNGEKIETQLVEIPSKIFEIQTRHSIATHEIVFIAYLKPISFKSYYVRKLQKVKRDVTDDQYIKENNDDIDNKLESGEDVIVVTGNTINFAEPKKFVRDYTADIWANEFAYSKELTFNKGSTQGESAVHDIRFDVEEMRMMGDEPLIVERLQEALGNEHVKLGFDNDTNEPTHLTLSDGTEVRFSIQFCYYPGAAGNNTKPSFRSSGAYILRPNATKPVELKSNVTLSPTGPIVNESVINTENGAVYIRFYKGLKYLEFDWVVGPIDISDNIGKEYIIRYMTDVVNNGEFYTDSNGRQILKRIVDKRPQYNVSLLEPVPGNYYPVVNRIYIKDDKTKISVLTDRSEGGTSLLEGQIELMLHRRLLRDDAFGVDEALNETVNDIGLIARGKHRIVITRPDSLEDKIEERKQVLQLHLQPQVFVSDATNVSYDDWMKLIRCFSWGSELPNGVHLLTLEPWFGNTLLLRLENFLERSDKSDTAIEVDLNSIFKTLRIKSFKETTLAANQWLNENEKWTWNTDEEFSDSFNKEYGNDGYVEKAKEPKIENDNGIKIKLMAKQIRTFVVKYEYT